MYTIDDSMTGHHLPFSRHHFQHHSCIQGGHALQNSELGTLSRLCLTLLSSTILYFRDLAGIIVPANMLDFDPSCSRPEGPASRISNRAARPESFRTEQPNRICSSAFMPKRCEQRAIFGCSVRSTRCSVLDNCERGTLLYCTYFSSRTRTTSTSTSTSTRKVTLCLVRLTIPRQMLD